MHAKYTNLLFRVKNKEQRIKNKNKEKEKDISACNPTDYEMNMSDYFIPKK